MASIYHHSSFPKLLTLIYDSTTPLKQTNKPSLPCPRTAGLTPCTPPAQRTGSTPSPVWPVEIYSPHSSSGPWSSWRAPSPFCSVPEVAKADARRRQNLRWQESTGTAAGSSLLALAICEGLVPELKSSDESWATLKQLPEVSSRDWVRLWGSAGRGKPKEQFSLDLSASESEIYGAHHLQGGNTYSI